MFPLLQQPHHRHQVSAATPPAPRTELNNGIDCFFSFSARTSDGKLHLLPEIGKIPLVDASLIEDPNESNSNDDDDGTFIHQKENQTKKTKSD